MRARITSRRANVLKRGSRNFGLLGSRGLLHISTSKAMHGVQRITLKLRIGNLVYDVHRNGKAELRKERCTTNKTEELGPYKASWQHPVTEYFKEEIEQAIKTGKK